MKVKIATWNINSVRLRMPLVERFTAEFAPDILCLQETKVRNSEFPENALRKLGYDHIAINGQAGYHGVATASRLPFAETGAREFCGKGDARHVSVTLDQGTSPVTLHNFYVPAGGDEPDREVNDKFGHKLDFLTEMTSWFAEAGNGHAERMVLVGDLNVAPLETDVWSHKQLLKVVSHTPIEIEHLSGRPGIGRLAGRGADAYSAGGKAIHLVELPGKGLAHGRQGPAPRPHLADPGARRRVLEDRRGQGRARMGEALRPRTDPGDA